MRIVQVDTHDAVLDTWREHGAHQEVLVHIDAHSDFFPGNQVDIGTFLYHAQRSEMIRSLYWVVPSLTFRYRRVVKNVVESLRRFGTTLGCRHGERSLRGEFEHLSIWIGALADLPGLGTDVLLDIDLDYFTTPIAERNPLDGLIIWEVPHALTGRLRESQISWDTVTVSTSVQGGYVPPQWKCLASALTASLVDGAEVPTLRILNKGALAYLLGRTDEARVLFERMTRQDHEDSTRSSAHLWLVRLLTETGNAAEARRHLQSAVEIDASSDTLWLCPAFGWWYQHRAGDIATCCREWRPVLTNTADLLALWAMALYRRDLEKSLRLAKEAHALNDRSFEVHLCLGRLNYRRNDFDSAVFHYEEALRLLRANGGMWMVPPSASSGSGLPPTVVVPMMKEMALAYAQAGHLGKAERYWQYVHERRLTTPCDIHAALSLLPSLRRSSRATRMVRRTSLHLSCQTRRLRGGLCRRHARLVANRRRVGLVRQAERRVNELDSIREGG